jgi:ankyrin repeat protein
MKLRDIWWVLKFSYSPYHEKMRKLHDRLSARDYDGMRRLAAAGADVNGSFGGMPLLQIATIDCPEGVRVLLELGAKPRPGDVEFVIELSTRAGEVLKVFLDHGIKIDTPFRNGTPALAEAIRCNQDGAVALLLDLGHDPFARDADGLLPLDHPGSRTGLGARAIKLLVERGYDVNRPLSKDGMTLLHGAAGAHEPAALEMAVFRAASLEGRDGEGRTPLHRAVRCGQLHNVAVLLHVGADPAARDTEGRTALDIFKERRAWSRNPALAEYVLSDDAGRPSDALLVEAVKENSPFLVHVLLRAGLDVNANDGAALHEAVSKGTPAVADTLLEWGADPMAGNGRAVDAALCRGMTTMMERMIQTGMSPGFIRKRVDGLAASGVLQRLSEYNRDFIARLLPPYVPGEPVIPPSVAVSPHREDRFLAIRRSRERLLRGDGRDPPPPDNPCRSVRP